MITIWTKTLETAGEEVVIEPTYCNLYINGLPLDIKDLKVEPIPQPK